MNETRELLRTEGDSGDKGEDTRRGRSGGDTVKENQPYDHQRILSRLTQHNCPRQDRSDLTLEELPFVERRMWRLKDRVVDSVTLVFVSSGNLPSTVIDVNQFVDGARSES